MSQCLGSNDGLCRCAFSGVPASVVGYLLLMTITFKLKIAEMLMASAIAAQCQVFDSQMFDVKVSVEHQPVWLRSVLPILDLLFSTHQEPYFGVCGVSLSSVSLLSTSYLCAFAQDSPLLATCPTRAQTQESKFFGLHPHRGGFFDLSSRSGMSRLTIILVFGTPCLTSNSPS